MSTREFAPPSFAFTPKERVSASEQINLLFAQEYGVFYFDLVEEIQTQGNSFMWCGAVYGTAFYNLNSAFRSQFNTYQYMVAMSGGSVMRQVGVVIKVILAAACVLVPLLTVLHFLAVLPSAAPASVVPLPPLFGASFSAGASVSAGE